MKKTGREYGDDDGYGDFRDDNPRRVEDDTNPKKAENDTKRSGANPGLGERPEAEKDKNVGKGIDTDIKTGPKQENLQQGTEMTQNR